MSEQHYLPRSRRNLWATVCVAVGVFAGTLAPAAAAVPGAATVVSATADGQAAIPQVSTAGHSLIMAGWFDSAGGVFDSMTGNRARVIQFATLAMLLALFVIWWRK
jgi:hypothetical protein